MSNYLRHPKDWMQREKSEEEKYHWKVLYGTLGEMFWSGGIIS
jgi:hypothetical protein